MATTFKMNNISNALSIIQSSVSERDDTIIRLKNRIAELERENQTLREMRLVSEKKEPDEFENYSKIQAKGHQLYVRGRSKNIPGKLVCTGQYTVPANQVTFSRILNLSDFFFPMGKGNLFENIYENRSTTTIFDRVNNFMLRNIDKIKESDYFISAINKSKKSGKKDLPNVNAAVIMWLLRHHEKDVIFMDPIDFLKDPFLATSSTPLKAINFSVVVRWIEKNIKYDLPVAPRHSNTGSVFVNYQRGQGVPTENEKRNIIRYIQRPSAAFVHVKLTPGKYDYSGKNSGIPKMCYSEFEDSVAQLVNQFTDLNEYIRFNGDTSLKRMYLVMDEFSGYSMFTIAALVGLGFDKFTTVLTYHRGSYSSFDLTN
jgi:hypothetical protein